MPQDNGFDDIESHTITVFVHEDYVGEVRALAESYPIAVRLGKFHAAEPTGHPSTFPVLDPTIKEALIQATIIFGTGTAALEFIKKLRDLISSSNGKVRARDNRSKEVL